jgi:hypothetical protein
MAISGARERGGSEASETGSCVLGEEGRGEGVMVGFVISAAGGSMWVVVEDDGGVGFVRYFGSWSRERFDSCFVTRWGSGRDGVALLVATAASVCWVAGSLAWCSCWCCCEKGNMENRVELRLWRFGGPGRSSACRREAADVGGGSEAECECEIRGGTGLCGC